MGVPTAIEAALPYRQLAADPQIRLRHLIDEDYPSSRVHEDSSLRQGIEGLGGNVGLAPQRLEALVKGGRPDEVWSQLRKGIF